MLLRRNLQENNEHDERGMTTTSQDSIKIVEHSSIEASLSSCESIEIVSPAEKLRDDKTRKIREKQRQKFFCYHGRTKPSVPQASEVVKSHTSLTRHQKKPKVPEWAPEETEED